MDHKRSQKITGAGRSHTVGQIAMILGVTQDQARKRLYYEGIKAVKADRAERGAKTTKINNNDQPCWECKWATGLEGKCPWTHATPKLPDGCIAKKVKNSSGETYKIIYCPLFAEG